MAAEDKPLVWLRGEVRTPPFTYGARVETGVLLRRLQRGEKLAMPQSRPMPNIGRHCHELRIPDGIINWRIVYCVKSDVIVILEVFRKTTRTTPVRVIADCRRRLSQYEATKSKI